MLQQLQERFPGIDLGFARELLEKHKNNKKPVESASNYIFDHMHGEYARQKQNLELNKSDLHNAEKLRSLFGLIASLPATEGKTILEFSEKLANFAWEDRNNIQLDHIDILADIISSLLQQI
ncbi:MAG: hypothetical protein EZS28_047036 [Streblomastix strix]|uniref:CUE domain-containing protein n=1 Tax=Streblomastix strix TaxID=222440 RepID=A0A5J4TGU1_9EUKA|nr:MAG: hypothetical protein EZS28_047036 [Streblomastix strix]